MDPIVAPEEINSVRIELSELGRSFRSSFRRVTSSFRSNSTATSLEDDDADADADDEVLIQWAAIDRQPTFERLTSSLFDENDGDSGKKKRVIDVTKLGGPEKHMFIEKLIKHIENDNLRLLQKQRKRMDKVGVKLPTVEVRYTNLCVEAVCEVVHGKPLPTLVNSLQSFISDFTRLPGLKAKRAKIKIVNDVSGIVKPGRLTLLLGPPGCGKTSLLKALSGNLDPSLKVTGEISYNGFKLKEFIPQRTSAYISQYDLHFPQMTVRETLDFSARCQGIGSRAEIMTDVCRKEKERGIVPDPDVDTFMKAISAEGQKTTLQTDYILKILGLDICANTLYGDAMRRGISGGQKKRLTTGAMIVGPTKALFMDEISNGLDSSTTYQIITCLQQLAHITDATVLVSLLQPAPETFDLFDDIMLMAEGKIVYHGARSHVLDFFESCGFRCPERKAVADFLQEVISRKDQAQFWHRTEQPHNYISVDVLRKRFKESPFGNNLDEDLSRTFLKSQTDEKAVSFNMYSLSNWTLFRACMSRELLLMRRNSFVYIFKSVQLVIMASVVMTVFIRTRMAVDVVHANYYMGAIYYAFIAMLFDATPESSMTVTRLPVFFKQRDMYLYPAWAYAIPASLVKVPMSLLVAIVWTSLTYYVIGFTPEADRFFRQLLMLFAWHLTSISMFRLVGSIFRTQVASSASGSLLLISFLMLGGFLIPHYSMPSWLRWGYWCSPLSYGLIGLSVNEFLAPRWTEVQANQRSHLMLPTNKTIGRQTLQSRGLDFDGYYYWISVGALFGFIILFNVGFTLALTYLKPPGSRAIISKEKLSQIQGSEVSKNNSHVEKSRSTSHKNSTETYEGNVVLPFEPLTLVFQDVQYYVDATLEMRERGGFTEKRLQLLSDVTGTFRPGVLTALMGVSGAGKTTLLDVLAGRKTSGVVEGEITIGGHPKVQDTFERISGYCEQTDVHSPQITVEESVIFSAWLRLHPEIDSKTKSEFVKQVLAIIELDEIKDALVGIPGVSGLSTEQRKRLTIAVELVANPSIIFMDEPTTGLDARSAAIVMRAVKNVVRTGRTTVCTIHQPSIDIFEAFDELVLLTRGGRMIYCGPLGQNSSRVIDYFQGISGVSKIKSNYNPATWMLDVTSSSAEAELGLDFAQIYVKSTLYQNNKDLAKRLSLPPSGSKQLHFPTRFPQNGWVQFKSCLWKQNLSYWRSPSYNLVRCTHMFASSLIFGVLFWDQGRKIDSQQSLFTIAGSMYAAVLFCGINNSAAAMPYVTRERTVYYRERFSGMYNSWAYAIAQVMIEIPYLFVQTSVYVIITYPMIGYYWTAYKVFWYFFAMFCTLLYYSYLGMLLVSITPNQQVAAILSSAFYMIFNLFSGFLIPLQQIPKWWIWLYYLAPTSWTLNGFLTSQYGDVDKEIVAFGETKTVAKFLEDYFGFHHDQLPLVAVVLVLYPLVFASLFAYFIGKLNFQRR